MRTRAPRDVVLERYVDAHERAVAQGLTLTAALLYKAMRHHIMASQQEARSISDALRAMP